MTTGDQKLSFLADRLLYKKNWANFNTKTSYDISNIKELKRIGQNLYSSRIITLDDETAALAYNISLNLIPEEIINQLAFFKLPSKKGWFEFRRNSILPET